MTDSLEISVMDYNRCKAIDEYYGQMLANAAKFLEERRMIARQEMMRCRIQTELQIQTSIEQVILQSRLNFREKVHQAKQKLQDRINELEKKYDYKGIKEYIEKEIYGKEFQSDMSLKSDADEDLGGPELPAEKEREDEKLKEETEGTEKLREREREHETSEVTLENVITNCGENIASMNSQDVGSWVRSVTKSFPTRAKDSGLEEAKVSDEETATSNDNSPMLFSETDTTEHTNDVLDSKFLQRSFNNVLPEMQRNQQLFMTSDESSSSINFGLASVDNSSTTGIDDRCDNRDYANIGRTNMQDLYETLVNENVSDSDMMLAVVNAEHLEESEEEYIDSLLQNLRKENEEHKGVIAKLSVGEKNTKPHESNANMPETLERRNDKIRHGEQTGNIGEGRHTKNEEGKAYLIQQSIDQMIEGMLSGDIKEHASHISDSESDILQGFDISDNRLTGHQGKEDRDRKGSLESFQSIANSYEEESMLDDVADLKFRENENASGVGGDKQKTRGRCSKEKDLCPENIDDSEDRWLLDVDALQSEGLDSGYFPNDDSQKTEYEFGKLAEEGKENAPGSKITGVTSMYEERGGSMSEMAATNDCRSPEMSHYLENRKHFDAHGWKETDGNGLDAHHETNNQMPSLLQSSPEVGDQGHYADDEESFRLSPEKEVEGCMNQSEAAQGNEGSCSNYEDSLTVPGVFPARYSPRSPSKYGRFKSERRTRKNSRKERHSVEVVNDQEFPLAINGPDQIDIPSSASQQAPEELRLPKQPIFSPITPDGDDLWIVTPMPSPWVDASPLVVGSGQQQVAWAERFVFPPNTQIQEIEENIESGSSITDSSNEGALPNIVDSLDSDEQRELVNEWPKSIQTRKDRIFAEGGTHLKDAKMESIGTEENSQEIEVLQYQQVFESDERPVYNVKDKLQDKMAEGRKKAPQKNSRIPRLLKTQSIKTTKSKIPVRIANNNSSNSINFAVS